MADTSRTTLSAPLPKAKTDRDADFPREGMRALGEALMETEVTQHVGAERYERSPERAGMRDGYREHQRDTRVGTVDLRVPRAGAMVASSQRFWSRAGDLGGPRPRSSSKRTSRESRKGAQRSSRPLTAPRTARPSRPPCGAYHPT